MSFPSNLADNLERLRISFLNSYALALFENRYNADVDPTRDFYQELSEKLINSIDPENVMTRFAVALSRQEYNDIRAFDMMMFMNTNGDLCRRAETLWRHELNQHFIEFQMKRNTLDISSSFK